MRVAIDILHPAHVHFFRHFRREMLDRGHDVLLTSRDKDCTLDLLERFDIPHTCLSTQRAGVGALGLELGLRTARLLRLAREFQPDVMMGIMAPVIALASPLLRTPAVAFYDNESARTVNRMVYRLADAYCTPEAYAESAGPHHERYRGYHELAYLHPRRFTPDPRIVEGYGLGSEPLFVLRFVAWESIHDVGETGLSLDTKRALIERLSARGRVVITSERPLPSEFEPYRLAIDVTDIHHVLAAASLLIGESSTMASEAACLGTHAFFVSKTGRGVNTEQQARYGNVHCFDHTQGEAVLARLDALLALPDLLGDGQARGQRLVEDNIDVTDFLVRCAERYAP
jgi:predicted glycosyltransferase